MTLGEYDVWRERVVKELSPRPVRSVSLCRHLIVILGRGDSMWTTTPEIWKDALLGMMVKEEQEMSKYQEVCVKHRIKVV